MNNDTDRPALPPQNHRLFGALLMLCISSVEHELKELRKLQTEVTNGYPGTDLPGVVFRQADQEGGWLLFLDGEPLMGIGVQSRQRLEAICADLEKCRLHKLKADAQSSD